jgi:hypothetical protein
VAILGDEHVGKSTLNSIQQSLAVELCSSIWLLLTAVLLAILIGYAIFTQHIITLKQCISHLIGLILSEPIHRMLLHPLQKFNLCDALKILLSSILLLSGATTFDQPSLHPGICPLI